MRSGDRFPASAVTGSAQSAPLSGASQSEPGQPGPAHRAARPVARRAWAALAWVVAGAALFALFLRISLADPPTSDPANNALQAWDMLHGHLLLHGWILGDVTFYTLELPLIAFVEIFFGLHTIAVHVAEALIYLIVTALAVAIAVTDSRGGSRVARAGVVAAVLAAPALIGSDMWIPLGFPDHTGTTVFVLVSFLLIDLSGRRSRGGSGGSSPPELAGKRFTAPLVGLILCVGQISDVTVRYVAVPAIVVVCGYRVLAARKFRTGDAATVVAAIVSVPLSLAVRALIRHFGAYVMVAPKTRIAPIAHWPHNAALTWYAVRMLFGISGGPVNHPRPLGVAAVFGAACLLLSVAGMVRVVWRWRTARRAEQLLLAAIVINVGVYAISTLPTPRTPHDLVAVLPEGAILGSRALVPRRIAGRLTALIAAGAAAVAALLPLSLAAARPPLVPPYVTLTAWLEDHGLHDGLGGYWDGGSVTLQSAGAVKVRTVHLVDGGIRPFPWETNTLWYNPARYYANFVIIDLTITDLVPQAERYFGKPVSSHRVGGWDILIYDRNVLRVVKPAELPPTR